MDTLKYFFIFTAAFLLVSANAALAQSPNLILTDQNGTQTAKFNLGDEVYIEGTCEPAPGTTAIHVYVSHNENWSGGEDLYDVSGGVEKITVPADGTIPRTKIWGYAYHEAGTTYDGFYDVLVDTNNDRILHNLETCVLGQNGAGFTVGNPTSATPPPPPAPPPLLNPEPVEEPPPVVSAEEQPSQPSQMFKLNSYVEVKSLSNVRNSPGGSLVGEQTSGAVGKVVGGPVEASLGNTNYWFWNIDFESGADGWAAELTLKSAPAPKPAPPLADTESEGSPPRNTSGSLESSEIEEREKAAEELIKELQARQAQESAQVAQVSDSESGNSIFNTLIIGLAIFLGFFVGSSIIAKAVRRS